MKKLKILFSIYLIVLFGCAATATYGVKPQQDIFDKDMYAFTIFYNAYSTSYDIEKRLKEEIKTFMEVESYSSFEVVNVHCGGLSKCIYEVKFHP